MAHRGQYLVLDRPRKLVFTFTVPKFSSKAAHVFIDIHSTAQGCELHLIQEGVQPADGGRAAKGWSSILQGLEDTLEGSDAVSSPHQLGEMIKPRGRRDGNDRHRTPPTTTADVPAGVHAGDGGNFVIRPAGPKDVQAIDQLLRSLPGVWQDSWREDALERALDSAGDLAFVAVQDASVIGFVSAHDVGFRAYLSELAVSDDHQREGVGSQLVRRIETELAARGCAVLIADVYPPAEPFYAERGWRPPHAILLGRRLGVAPRSA